MQKTWKSALLYTLGCALRKLQFEKPQNCAKKVLTPTLPEGRTRSLSFVGKSFISKGLQQNFITFQNSSSVLC